MSLILAVTIAWGSRYAPGVSQSVIHVRQHHNVARTLPLRLPPTDGYIAVAKCDEIGHIWYLRPFDTEAWESFLVIDCSGSAETTAWMRTKNIIVEFDHETMLRWGIGPGRGVKIERGREYKFPLRLWGMYETKGLQRPTNSQEYRRRVP